MSEFQRGIVKKIIFEIEYPDGSRKEAELTDAETIVFIALADEHVSLDDTGLFNVSESDWKENPAMIVHRVDPENGPCPSHSALTTVASNDPGSSAFHLRERFSSSPRSRRGAVWVRAMP